MIEIAEENCEDIIFETHLQKFLHNEEYINEVKEEIIQINSLDYAMVSYVVVCE